MKVLTRFFFFYSLFLFFSCGEKKQETWQDDSKIRYKYYNLENQGWKSQLHSQKIDNIDFTATQVPIQYYLLKEMGSSSLTKVDSIYQENKKERIIEFTFQEKNENDLLKEKFTGMEYQKSVEYMSFTIQKDFYVVSSSKDTIKCSGVLFERNFKVAPFNKIMLFFSGIEPNDNIQLIYQDNLFKKGTIKFSFSDQLLNLQS